jgi:hypothetical protein
VLAWRPVIDYDLLSGSVAAGTVLAGVTPASAFALRVNGHQVPESVSLGGVAVFTTPKGEAQLVLHQWPLNGIIAFLMMVVWLAFALGFGALEFLERLTRRRYAPTRVPATPSPREDELP